MDIKLMKTNKIFALPSKWNTQNQKKHQYKSKKMKQFQTKDIPVTIM
jgi:hypothetical protein